MTDKITGVVLDIPTIIEKAKRKQRRKEKIADLFWKLVGLIGEVVDRVRGRR